MLQVAIVAVTSENGGATWLLLLLLFSKNSGCFWIVMVGLVAPTTGKVKVTYIVISGNMPKLIYFRVVKTASKVVGIEIIYTAGYRRRELTNVSLNTSHPSSLQTTSFRQVIQKYPC